MTEGKETTKRQSLFNRADSGAYCSVGARTWSRLHASGKIPRPVKIGGSVRWRLSDLDLWIAMDCPERQEFEARKGVEK